MTSDTPRTPADPKDRAKAVVTAVAEGREVMREHGLMSRIVTLEVLEDVVDAAYRTQFDEDRTRFRQRVAALGEDLLQQLPTKD